jgi:hypothetical protein
MTAPANPSSSRIKNAVTSAVDALLSPFQSAEAETVAKLEAKLIAADAALKLAQENEAECAYLAATSDKTLEGGAKADKARLLSKIASETKTAAEQALGIARAKNAAVAAKAAQAAKAAVAKEEARVKALRFEKADAAHDRLNQAIIEIEQAAAEVIECEIAMRSYLDDAEWRNSMENARVGIVSCVSYAMRGLGAKYPALAVERFKLRFYLPSQYLFTKRDRDAA